MRALTDGRVLRRPVAGWLVGMVVLAVVAVTTLSSAQTTVWVGMLAVWCFIWWELAVTATLWWYGWRQLSHLTRLIELAIGMVADAAQDAAAVASGEATAPSPRELVGALGEVVDKVVEGAATGVLGRLWGWLLRGLLAAVGRHTLAELADPDDPIQAERIAGHAVGLGELETLLESTVQRASRALGSLARRVLPAMGLAAVGLVALQAAPVASTASMLAADTRSPVHEGTVSAPSPLIEPLSGAQGCARRLDARIGRGESSSEAPTTWEVAPDAVVHLADGGEVALTEQHLAEHLRASWRLDFSERYEAGDTLPIAVDASWRQDWLVLQGRTLPCDATVTMAGPLVGGTLQPVPVPPHPLERVLAGALLVYIAEQLGALVAVPLFFYALLQTIWTLFRWRRP